MTKNNKLNKSFNKSDFALKVRHRKKQRLLLLVLKKVKFKDPDMEGHRVDLVNKLEVIFEERKAYLERKIQRKRASGVW